jgi:hypothetical protein
MVLRVTDKKRHAKESVYNNATVPRAIIGFDF